MKPLWVFLFTFLCCISNYFHFCFYPPRTESIYGQNIEGKIDCKAKTVLPLKVGTKSSSYHRKNSSRASIAHILLSFASQISSRHANGYSNRVKKKYSCLSAKINDSHVTFSFHSIPWNLFARLELYLLIIFLIFPFVFNRKANLHIWFLNEKKNGTFRPEKNIKRHSSANRNHNWIDEIFEFTLALDLSKSIFLFRIFPSVSKQ